LGDFALVLLRTFIIAGYLALLTVTAAPVRAQGVDRASLLPEVERAVARSVSDIRSLWTCLSSLPEDRLPSAMALADEAWMRTRGTWIGTLWATGFGDDQVARIVVRLDEAAKDNALRRPQGSCPDAAALLDAYLNRDPLIDTRVIAARGIDWGEVIIDTPDSTERIEATLTPRLRRWARLLACANLLEEKPPIWLEASAINETAWALEVHRLRVFLKTRGLPGPKVGRVVARAILQVRWNRPQVFAQDCAALDPSDKARWGEDAVGRELSAIAAGVTGVSPP
jgi:hypothetical protein